MDNIKPLAWPAVLAATTVIGSLIAACMMPFVALAVVIAASLPARQAIFALTAIFAVNQAIGFIFLGFPLEAYTFTWGAAIGVATVATWATARLLVNPAGDLNAARLALAGAAAFVTYEALLFVFATQAGGKETFTSAIIAQLAQNEAIWLAVLVTLRVGVATTAPAIFGAQRLRLA